MSDDLKKHIDQNRETFEVYPFDVNQGWNELSRQIQPSRRKLNWWYAAAGIVLVLGLGFTVLQIQPVQSTYTSEIQETQFYYQGMIDAKLTQVKNQLDDPRLLNDLEQLDMAFEELNNDLADNAQNEEVVRAMIDNYRLKLKILERILEDLDEGNDETDPTI